MGVQYYSEWAFVDCIPLAQDEEELRALAKTVLNTAMDLLVP
jgi:hypothetical protein